MNAKQYVRAILERSCLPGAERKRVKADLKSEIDAQMERGKSIEEIIERMGRPDEVAAGLYESFSDTPRPFREYKSQKTLFGLPLVHIIKVRRSPGVSAVRGVGARVVNVGGRYGTSYVHVPTARGVFACGPKAKGVIAVGNLSSGLISVGNVSLGLVSLGNVSAGLVSVGNLALAALLALGNLVVGALAAGNLAYGCAAAGNLAIGRYAIGSKAAGVHSLEITHLPAQIEQARAFFAGLDAPAPVKAFFAAVERVFDMLLAPAGALPAVLAAAAVVIGLIATVAIVRARLLAESE